VYQFANLDLIQGNTREPAVAAEVAKRGPIDLLFIDTDHVAEQVKAEMALFGPLMTPGGLILLDDVRMHPCMASWWEDLAEEKLELPEMHWTSFGVIFR